MHCYIDIVEQERIHADVWGWRSMCSDYSYPCSHQALTKCTLCIQFYVFCARRTVVCVLCMKDSCMCSVHEGQLYVFCARRTVVCVLCMKDGCMCSVHEGQLYVFCARRTVLCVLCTKNSCMCSVHEGQLSVFCA